jgi:hypothetical protein
MAKLGQLKRISAEDFDKKDRDFVNRLAFVLNPFLNALANALDNSLTIEDNLVLAYQDIQFTAPITPNTPVTVLSPLNVLVRGLEIIRVDNLDSPVAVLPASPFLEFTNGDGKQIIITNSTGFIPGTRYKVRVVVHP